MCLFVFVNILSKWLCILNFLFICKTIRKQLYVYSTKSRSTSVFNKIKFKKRVEFAFHSFRGNIVNETSRDLLSMREILNFSVHKLPRPNAFLMPFWHITRWIEARVFSYFQNIAIFCTITCRNLNFNKSLRSIHYLHVYILKSESSTDKINSNLLTIFIICFQI